MKDGDVRLGDEDGLVEHTVCLLARGALLLTALVARDSFRSRPVIAP